jgi:hypothetical protein
MPNGSLKDPPVGSKVDEMDPSRPVLAGTKAGSTSTPNELFDLSFISGLLFDFCEEI